MDSNSLIAAGLQPQQAQAYALLLKHGQLTPPQVATKLKLTRTNAYKLLDKLSELGLAEKVKANKKFAYKPGNPLALNQIVHEARNQVVIQEEAAKAVMSQLLDKYFQQTNQTNAKIVVGRDAVVQAFKEQINLEQAIYFIRSKSDITAMGFDTMHQLRMEPSHNNQDRFGITPDYTKGSLAKESERRSNLTRTWVKNEDYTAPVEWSVSGNILLIVIYTEVPQAIIIANPIVADAFLQLWKIIDTCLRAMPYYKSLPRLKG